MTARQTVRKGREKTYLPKAMKVKKKIERGNICIVALSKAKVLEFIFKVGWQDL